MTRERHYWIAAAALHDGDAASAAAEADRGLTLLGAIANDEVRWRLASIGAVAAGQRGDAGTAGRLNTMARESLERLRITWRADIEPYLRRPDLAELVKKKEQQ